MAHGAMAPTGKTKHYPGKTTFALILICFLAASGGLMFGYDVGISGGVTSMDEFLSKFFPVVLQKELEHVDTDNAYCKYNDQKLQAFTSSLYIAAFLGSPMSSYITRHYGRRATMLVAGIIFCIGVALQGAAQNIIMLYIGRVLLGLGVGFSAQVVPLYLSETAPSQRRGALNSLFQLAITIGILLANLVNFGTEKMQSNGWRVSLVVAGIPALLITFGGIILPDTPNSLVQRGKLDEGRKVLQHIRGVDDVDQEFQDIIIASNEVVAIEQKNSFFNIFKPHNRPQLIISMFLQFFQQFTGINAIMFYAPVLFQTVGFGNSAALYSSVIVGVVNLFSTLVAIYLVDCKGRRWLLLEGCIQMFVAQVLIAIILALGLKGTTMASYLGWIAVVLVCIYVSAFAWSWGPLAWLIASEIYPLDVRSIGQAITVSTNMLFTFVIGQVFLSILCAFRWGVFVFFAGWVVVMMAFTYWFIPETKSIHIEDMDSVWTKHWYWKRFVPFPTIPHPVSATTTNNLEIGLSK